MFSFFDILGGLALALLLVMFWTMFAEDKSQNKDVTLTLEGGVVEHCGYIKYQYSTGCFTFNACQSKTVYKCYTKPFMVTP